MVTESLPVSVVEAVSMTSSPELTSMAAAVTEFWKSTSPTFWLTRRTVPPLVTVSRTNRSSASVEPAAVAVTPPAAVTAPSIRTWSPLMVSVVALIAPVNATLSVAVSCTAFPVTALSSEMSSAASMVTLAVPVSEPGPAVSWTSWAESMSMATAVTVLFTSTSPRFCATSRTVPPLARVPALMTKSSPPPVPRAVIATSPVVVMLPLTVTERPPTSSVVAVISASWTAPPVPARASMATASPVRELVPPRVMAAGEPSSVVTVSVPPEVTASWSRSMVPSDARTTLVVPLMVVALPSVTVVFPWINTESPAIAALTSTAPPVDVTLTASVAVTAKSTFSAAALVETRVTSVGESAGAAPPMASVRSMLPASAVSAKRPVTASSVTVPAAPPVSVTSLPRTTFAAPPRLMSPPTRIESLSSTSPASAVMVRFAKRASLPTSVARRTVPAAPAAIVRLWLLSAAPLMVPRMLITSPAPAPEVKVTGVPAITSASLMMISSAVTLPVTRVVPPKPLTVSTSLIVTVSENSVSPAVTVRLSSGVPPTTPLNVTPPLVALTTRLSAAPPRPTTVSLNVTSATSLETLAVSWITSGVSTVTLPALATATESSSLTVELAAAKVTVPPATVLSLTSTIPAPAPRLPRSTRAPPADRSASTSTFTLASRLNASTALIVPSTSTVVSVVIVTSWPARTLPVTAISPPPAPVLIVTLPVVRKSPANVTVLPESTSNCPTSPSARSMFSAELRSSVFNPTVSPSSIPLPAASVASIVTVPLASLSVVWPTPVVVTLAATMSPVRTAAGPVSVNLASPATAAPLVVNVTSSISARLPPLTVTDTLSSFSSSAFRSTNAVVELSVLV